MTTLTLLFRSSIPATLKDAAGRDTNTTINGKKCLPLFPLLPNAFASYATDTSNSARLYTVVNITFNKRKVEMVDIRHSCDVTTQYPGIFSLDRQKRTAKETPVYTNAVYFNGETVNIKFTSKGCNPFFNYFGYKLAPPIETNYDISISPMPHDPSIIDEFNVDITGHVTLFPAHSISMCVNNKVASPTYTYLPEQGKTPSHLFFGAAKHIALRTKIKAVAPTENHVSMTNI